MKHMVIGIWESAISDSELLIQYLNIAEACLSIEFKVYTYTTGASLLDSYRAIFDIIFLNVPISDMDTKILISKLRQQDKHVRLILTSKNSELFFLGYEYNAINYYIKPLRYPKILSELKKYLSDGKLPERPNLWISTQQTKYRLYLYKLRYIETSNRQLLIYYGSEKIQYHGNLIDFQHQLPNNFFRCNNSYIVNVNYIEQVQKDISRYTIHLITGEQIPLSRNKRREQMEILSFASL